MELPDGGLRARLGGTMGVSLIVHDPTVAGILRGGLAFGYLLVRIVAAVVFVLGTRDDPKELKAVVRYRPVSLGAAAIVVIGGLVGGEALQWIWLAAFCVGLIAVAFAGQATRKVDAGHFAERHGLILIIARDVYSLLHYPMVLGIVILVATLSAEHRRFRTRIRGEVADPETAIV